MSHKFKLSSILALVTLTFASFTTAQTMTVPQGTPIRLRLTQNVSNGDAKAGDAINLKVLDDVKVGQVIAIRYGAQARGRVTEAHLEAANGSRWGGCHHYRVRSITAGIVGSAVFFVPAFS